MNQADSFQPPITVSNTMPLPRAPTTALGRMLRSAYLAALTWAFTRFNSLRVVSYPPAMWAIQASGDSSQHSLWTWGTWLGANVTMAAWLYGQNAQRLSPHQLDERLVGQRRGAEQGHGLVLAQP